MNIFNYQIVILGMINYKILKILISQLEVD